MKKIILAIALILTPTIQAQYFPPPTCNPCGPNGTSDGTVPSWDELVNMWRAGLILWSEVLSYWYTGDAMQSTYFGDTGFGGISTSYCDGFCVDWEEAEN